MDFGGGSDSHNGRPGNDTPGFQHRRYAKAGLTAVYAPELTIAAVLEAYKTRRIYATTGAYPVGRGQPQEQFFGVIWDGE